MSWRSASLCVAFAFVVTALSPFVQPVAADPPGAGDPPTPPGPGPINDSGGDGPEPPGAGSYVPVSQTLLNGTQTGGDCGTTWTALNNSDDVRCSYQEANKAPANQLGVVLLPDGTDVNGWAATGCSMDATPWDELDDGPDTDDGDASCRQGSTNGNRVGVTLQNPTWTDRADVDDFNVTSSAVVKKVPSQGASVSIDVKYESSYSTGTTQSTTTSYVRYSRVDDKKPGTSNEWNATNIDNLVVAVQCIDCSPNNRVTQAQAKVDAKYNPEYALEVRFAWAGIPVAAETWLLVVECTRLINSGAENVLVQVGQGGGSPTSWRTAYTCSSDTDQAAPVLPLSITELNNGAPVVRVWDAQADEPDDTLRGTMSFDVLRIDVGPDGSVNSSFAQPLNYTSAYANNTVSPTLIEDNVSYTYVTTFGNYTFPRTAPHILRVWDLDDRQMADASSFVIEGNVATSVSGSYVVSRSNTSFQARYNVTSGSLTQGTMDLTAVFNATTLPKLTATFAQSPNSTLSSWHVRWKITSPARYLKNNDETTMYYGGFGTPQLVGSSPTDIPPRATIGIESVSSLWNSTVIANWSDMGAGTLYVGPLTIDANYTGFGMMIAFGAQVPFVDPSLVAQSYDSYATRYTNQKKVFYHDGRYYTFFHHGSGTTQTIRYSVGREVYSTEQPSASAMVWNAPIAAVATPSILQFGFDVDQRDGVVGLVWFDDVRYLKFMKGTVRGDVIDWSPAVYVDSIPNYYSEIYVPTMTIGLDGFFWIAVSGRKSGSPLRQIDTFRSTEPEGTTFASEDSFTVSDVRVTLRLVPFPGGNMMLLASEVSSTEITWRTWYSVTSQWSAPRNTALLQLEATEKVDRIAAAGVLTSTGALLTKVVYIDDLKRVKVVWLYEALQSGPTELDAGPAWYPTIQADANNDVHYFWTEKPCALCSKRIYYRWESYNGMSATVSPFLGTSDPAYLTSGSTTLGPRAFIAYTEYPGGKVYFASVPTRRGGGGAGDAAWQRPGISPHGLYFQQLSESVSVGSGLLYVKQTDLSIPGRGLDLSVQRLYRTPDAFAAGSAWGYDEPRSYSLGQGWTLNFPWNSWNYLYLWDGQRYVIKYDGNVFENKEGEYFRLERVTSSLWYLYTKSGVKYTMNPSLGGPTGGVTSITDLNGNVISFSYDPTTYRLNSITDTMGRSVTFDYTPNPPHCNGSNDTPPKICSVTYGGRTVQYWYSGGLLTTVLDPIMRTTAYEYCTSLSVCTGVANTWLVHATVYPTGARTVYVYRSVQVGTDATAWVVTAQKVQDADWVTTIRKKTYAYDFVNGAVAYAKVTHFAGDTSGTVQGYTLHNMDALAGTATTTQVATSGAKIDQQRVWYGQGGRATVVDAYKGAAAADGNDITYSTYTHYDVWGNPVYERDPLGKESFQSYYISNNGSAFYAPGRLDVTTQGKVWTENFRDRDILDWGKDATDGVVALDVSTFGVLPPSLQVKTNVANCCYNAAAWHTFPAQGWDHVVNVLVRLDESNKDHFIELKSASTLRVQLNFAANGKLKYSDGGAMTDGPAYVAGQWYRLTIRPLSSTTYDLYLGGATVRLGSAMMNSGAVDTIRFRAGNGGALAGMWVNEIHVFKGTTIVVNGIQYGTRVRVLDPKTGKALIPDTKVLSQSATFSPGVIAFPGMIIQVLDWEWSPIYTSPSREFWGGSVFNFVEPQFLKSGITKLSSGFLRYNAVWLNDRPLPGAETSDAEGWVWKSDGAQVSGVEYHVSYEQAARHGHGFRNANPVLCDYSGGEYYIQYVYLRPDAFPAEVLRAFEGYGAGDDWNHRAYWGWNVDGLGGTPGTDARRNMGTIPMITDRWLMLIVKHNDISDDIVDCFEGTSYTVVSGGANWDLTAKGDAQTGRVKVRGLPPGWSAVLYTPKGALMGSAIADGNGVATLEVYAPGSSYRNAFPTTGMFRVYDSVGWPIYASPWFENIFGGDEFQYSASDFYASGYLSALAKDRLAGTYRVQGTDYLGNPVVQESYYEYDSSGNVLTTKARGPGGTWSYSYRTYDGHGSALTARAWVAGAEHTTTYAYDAAYQSAYLTSVSDGIYGSTALTYDFNTGNLLTVTPPKTPAQTTSYEYDAVGRTTKVTYPGGKFVTYTYYDSTRLVVLKDEMYSEPTRKRQTWQCYDAIGRLTDVLRFGDAGPTYTPSCAGLASSGYYSWEKYTNNWQDQVTLYTDAMGRLFRRTYDFPGRVTQATNPDGEYVSISYDDATNTKTVTVPTPFVQNARKTVYVSDRDNRLTEVREFWGGGANDYYATTYAYDNVGNLLQVDTPPDSLGAHQRTNHSYDPLGRLTWTKFPDDTHEEYSYFVSGLLQQKRDRAGGLTTFTYDDLKRLNVATYPDGTTADNDYDLNGNLLKLVSCCSGGIQVTLDYTYDARDRLKTETTTVGTARTVTYDYDDAGNVVRIQGPAGSGYDVYYAYDAMNRACAVSSVSISSCAPGTYYALLSYNADDSLSAITYETGNTDVTTTYTYGTNGWPSAIETSKGASTIHLRLDYEDYDALGNPVRIKHSGSVATTYECFTYDALNRLVASNTATASTCAYAVGAWSWNLGYQYDAVGNRVQMADGPPGSQTTTYSLYDTYSRLCRTKTLSAPTLCTETGSGVNEYAYDANGQLTSRKVAGTTTGFAWAAGGALCAWKTGGTPTGCADTTANQYQYDGMGRRVRSVVGGTADVYVYSGLSVIYETSPAAKYVFAAGMRLAKIGASTEYYHYDALGNVRVVTSGSNGNVLSKLAYKPFGIVVVVTGSEPTYGYTGEYRESIPNLIYLGSRWYDPTIGRFLSPDDRLGRLSMPQDQNRYAYVGNNPIAYADPTGHDFLGDVGNAIVGMAMFPIDTAKWLVQRASWQEVVGFFAGIAVALLVGIAIGLACATIVGCPIALALLAGALVGGVLSSITYIVVTTALGGTPTEEGLGYAFGWGMFAGGLGASLGFGFGTGSRMTAGAKGAAAEGETAPEVASASAPDPSISKRPSGFRKPTIEEAWSRAADGPTGGKLCPSCGKEVHLRSEWDMSHDPAWTKRPYQQDFTTRQQYLNDYNAGVFLECRYCNRGRGNRPVTYEHP